MRLLGFSNREIERRMEIHQGSVSRVLTGHIEAKLSLVLGVARSIGLGYDEFFAFAYPERRSPEEESAAARSVRALLEDIRPTSRRPARPFFEEALEPPLAGPINRDDLIEGLKKAIREIMSEMRPAGEGGPKAGHE